METVMSLTVALGSTCVVLFVVLTILSRRRKHNKLPPGPRGVPVFGNFLKFDYKTAHLQMTEWSKEFGDICMFNIMGRNVMTLSSPDLIHKAFVSEEFSPYMSDRPSSFLGRHIACGYKDLLFRKYDDTCRKVRGATCHAMQLHGDASHEFYENMNEEFKLVVAKFKATDGAMFDPMVILNRSICKMCGILFKGRRFDDADPELEILVDFDHWGDRLVQPKTHATLKSFPILRKMPGRYGEMCRRMLAGKENLFQKFVMEMKDSYNREDTRCFVHALLKIQEDEVDENGTPWLTDEYINGIIMDLINTSVLTSKGILSGFLLLLLNFPEMQERIRQEIYEVIGDIRMPTIEDMCKMPYTQACMFEALRYQSHLPVTAGHCNSQCEVEFEGYTIPKNTVIYGNLWAIHHDERLWQEPWTFNPNRFLQEDGTLVPAEHTSRKQLMAFGVGKRSCVGRTMAMNRLFLYTTNILQHLQLCVPEGVALPQHDPRHLVPGTVLIAPSFQCRAIARHNQQ